MGKNKNKNRNRQFPEAGQTPQRQTQSSGTATATAPPQQEQKQPTTPAQGENVKLPISSTPKVEVPTVPTKKQVVFNSLQDLKKVATPVANTEKKAIPEGVPSGNTEYPFTGVVSEVIYSRSKKGTDGKPLTNGFIVYSGKRRVFLPMTTVTKGAIPKTGDTIHFQESALLEYGPKVAKYVITSENISEVFNTLDEMAKAYSVRTYTKEQLMALLSQGSGNTEERLVELIGNAVVLTFTTGQRGTLVYALATEATTANSATTNVSTGNNQ